MDEAAQDNLPKAKKPWGLYEKDVMRTGREWLTTIGNAIVGLIVFAILVLAYNYVDRWWFKDTSPEDKAYLEYQNNLLRYGRN